MSTYNVLILDPGESTGYCLAKVDTATNSADIYEYGYITVDVSSEYKGDWCLDLSRSVKALIAKHDIKHVGVEDYFFSSKFVSGTDINGAYRTVIHMATRQLSLPYTILNISLWKKYVAGSSTASKEQKLKWGKEAAKKLYMQQALWECHGIRFTNHSISENTGKPIIFRYDIVDAVAQTIFFCRIHLNLQAVTHSVIPAPDVVFKKKAKNSYEYPKV